MSRRRPSLDSPRPFPRMITLLSDRSATLVLAAFGASANFYGAYRLLATWLSVRKWEESEWEGGFTWKVDSAKALGTIVCAYLAVGGIASVVGLVGVIKRRTSNVRLFRDYCIADTAFGFASMGLLAYFAKKSLLRSMLCEELSRQPDILRSLSDSAGLNVENCESFLRKAFVGLVIVLGVVMFIRLQFTLTVLNYYTHLRRAEQRMETMELNATSRRSRSRSASRSSRILLLSHPLTSISARNDEEKEQPRMLIYAPVHLTEEQAKKMRLHDAYLSLPSREREDLEDTAEEGRIRLSIHEGEGLSGVVA